MAKKDVLYGSNGGNVASATKKEDATMTYKELKDIAATAPDTKLLHTDTGAVDTASSWVSDVSSWAEESSDAGVPSDDADLHLTDVDG